MGCLFLFAQLSKLYYWQMGYISPKAGQLLEARGPAPNLGVGTRWFLYLLYNLLWKIEELLPHPMLHVDEYPHFCNFCNFASSDSAAASTRPPTRPRVGGREALSPPAKFQKFAKMWVFIDRVASIGLFFINYLKYDDGYQLWAYPCIKKFTKLFYY